MRSNVGFALLVALVAGCADTCKNNPIATANSPAGEMRAVLFQRDCGSTTGYSSQVSLVSTRGTERGGGNVFIADTDHGAAIAAWWGGPWVELRWLSPKHLLIRYDARARVFTQNQTVSGVSIAYEKIAR
jgi:hypothetical protein